MSVKQCYFVICQSIPIDLFTISPIFERMLTMALTTKCAFNLSMLG